MKEIAGSKNKRFILTTREYLLQQAKLSYERLTNPFIDLAKCIVDLADYTRLIRAKILYNHLYFSQIPDSYKAELLENNFYNRIINHQNFNPRIIEAMVNLLNIQHIPQQLYCRTFEENLNKPYRIWDFAFNNQISQASRQLLAIMLTIVPLGIANLRNLFLASTHFIEADFMRSLKELDGCFIKTEKQSIQSNQLAIRFDNPSISDFLQSHIASTDEFLEDLIAKARYFNQLRRLWGSPFSTDIPPLRKAILRHSETLITRVGQLLVTPIYEASSRYFDMDYGDRALLILDFYNRIKDSKLKDLLIELIRATNKSHIQNYESLLNFVEKCKTIDQIDNHELNFFILEVKRVIIDEAINYGHGIDFLRILGQFLDKNEQYITEEEKQALEENVNDFLSYGYESEIEDMSTTEKLQEFLEDITEIANYWQADVRRAEQAIAEKLENLERIAEHEAEEQLDYLKEMNYAPVQNSDDSEIEKMFSPETLHLD